MKQRRIAAVLAGSLMTAALGAYVAPMAHADGDPGSPGIVSAQDQQAAIKYWTPKRMREAKNLDVTRFATNRTTRSHVAVGKQRIIRAASATDQNPNAAANTGGKWTKGGKVVQTTGKVFFTVPSGEPAPGNYVCSGSVAPANNKSVIITAGHCVNDANDHQAAGGDKKPGVYVENWVFVPEYDGNATNPAPKGEYAASKLMASTNWTNKADFNYDVGLATVGKGSTSNNLVENAQGSQGLGFNLPRHQFVEAFGYPAEDPYDGTTLDYAAGSALNADANGVDNPGNSATTDDPGGSNDQVMKSNLTGGSSGGPWFYNFNEGNGTGTQMSLNSFSYDGISKADQQEYKIPADNMWGPYFGKAIESLFDKAQGPAPKADDKSTSTPEETAKDITVSGTKSTSSDPTPLTYKIKTQPKHGKVTLSGTTATYTPDKNYNGKDSFTYVSNNGINNSAPATVTINVTPVEDPPAAADVTGHTRTGKAVDVTLKGTDPDKGDKLTYAQASDASDGGTVKISGDTATYTPADGTGATASEKVTFTYTVSDGQKTSDPATATVTVSPNSAPVGHDDSYKVDSEQTLSVKAPGVLKNDTDADDDTLSAVLVGQAPDGLNFKSDGSFTYDAPKTYKDKTVTFTYRATDGVDDAPATDRATRDAPRRTPLAYSEDVTVTISIAAATRPSPTPSPSPTQPPSSPSPSPSQPPASSAPPTSAPPSSQAPNGPLGDTGSPFSPAVIGFGLLTVAAGAGTLVAARRRRS